MKGHILITGASTGIGRAAAIKFAKEGYHVFGTVRKAADGSELDQLLGANFSPIIMDVQNQESIDAAKVQVQQMVGNQGLACLVNNAGVAVNGPLLHIPIDELAYQLDVNVLGVVRVTQAFGNLLGAGSKSKYAPGRIINISSVSGLVTRQFMGPYSASKYALEAISDALRRELSMYGIKVIIIEPGPIKTEIWRKAAEEKPKYMDTDYAPVFRNVSKYVGDMEKVALPVEQCADLIYRSFTSPNPKTRYLIAPMKRFFWLAAYVFPDKMLDRMFDKQFSKFMKQTD